MGRRLITVDISLSTDFGGRFLPELGPCHVIHWGWIVQDTWLLVKSGIWITLGPSLYEIDLLSSTRPFWMWMIWFLKCSISPAPHSATIQQENAYMILDTCTMFCLCGHLATNISGLLEWISAISSQFFEVSMLIKGLFTITAILLSYCIYENSKL